MHRQLKSKEMAGKIMHSKAWQNREIRCYFAYTPSQAASQFDWHEFVQNTIAQQDYVSDIKLIKLKGSRL